MELKVASVLNGRLSVRRTSNVLLDLFAVEANLMRSIAGWVARTGPTEIKLELVRQLYEDSRHADSLRSRIQQLRTSLSWTTQPPPAWRLAFDVLDAAPTVQHFLAALYQCLKPALCAEYRRLRRASDIFSDEPTLNRLAWILEEEEAHVQWGRRKFRELHLDAVSGVSQWLADYAQVLEDAALVGASSELPTSAQGAAGKHDTGFWQKEFAPLPRSVKDPRYSIVSKDFPLHPAIAATDDLSTSGGVANRLHRMLPFEYSTLEACSRNIFEFCDMPWRFYLDMARIAWDERRHAITVIQRLNELDSDVGDFPLPPWTAYEIVMSSDLKDRLLMLHRILEGDALDLYVQRVADLHARDPETARIYDFIEADEIGHTLLGQRWYFHLVGNDREQIERDSIRGWSSVAPKWLCAHEKLSLWAQGKDPDVARPREYVGPSYYELDRKVPIARVGRQLAGFTPSEVERFIEASSGGSVEF
ncbi:MAG TPA: DUF455 family protein [Polyangiaceae bacterium]